MATPTKKQTTRRTSKTNLKVSRRVTPKVVSKTARKVATATHLKRSRKKAKATGKFLRIRALLKRNIALLAAVVLTGFIGLAFLAVSNAAPLPLIGSKAAPAAPTNLQAFTGGNSVNIRWQFNGDKATVKNYLVYRDGKAVGLGKPGVGVGSVYKDGTRFNDLGIKPGKTYTYEVTATFKNGSKMTKKSKKLTVKIPTKTTPVPRVTVDASAAPELKAWATNAVTPELKTWYPKLADRLVGVNSPNVNPKYKLASEITIRFSDPSKFENPRALAVASTNVITINIDHFQQPENQKKLGTIIHEAVHIIQYYTNSPADKRSPSWLRESMADYGSLFIYGNNVFLSVNDKVVKEDYYTNGYEPGARFLDWIQRTYKQPDYVRKLNLASQLGTLNGKDFRLPDGKNIDEAWAQMLKSTPHTGAFASRDWKGMCLSVQGGKITNGTPIQMAKCARSDAQKMTAHLNSYGLQSRAYSAIHVYGSCLEVKGGSKQSGTPVIINNSCNEEPSQQWQLHSSGIIQNPIADMCLAPAKSANGASAKTAGAQLIVKECDSSPEQYWTVPKGSSITQPVQPISLKADPLLCVQAKNVNDQVLLGPCDKNVKQRWRLLNTDHGTSLLVNGSREGCLQVDAKTKTIVAMQACFPTKYADWIVLPNGLIRNLGAGTCLTAGDKPATGALLNVVTCNDKSANQLFPLKR